jgi:S1-C subfamily serine protease
VIVEVDGQKVVQPDDLARLVAEKLPGEKIDLTILRDNKRMQVTVTLGKRPDKVE